MTDFDKAAEQVVGTESDPFDASAGGVVDTGRTALRSSLYTSLMVNPDMAARSQKLGRKVGLPADVVERNLPEVERNAQLNEFDKLLDNSPVVATWLADQNNAKVAHDDTDNLVGIERTLRGTAGDVAVTALKGAVGLPNAVVGLLDIPTGGKVGKTLDSVGVRFNESSQILDSMYSPAQQAANREVRQADGFVDTLGAAVKNPSVIATTVGESIPQMIGGAGIARRLMAYLPKLSPLVAGAIGEGTLGAGSAAEQTRAQNTDGELTAKQSLAAVGSGVGTGLFGFVGNKLSDLLKVGDIDTALVKGSMIDETPTGLAAKDVAEQTTAQVAKDFAAKIAKGGVSEGLFEEFPQSAQEQMWQNFATDRPIMEGVGNASAMGILSGTAMGGVFAGVQHTAERRAQAAQAAEQSSAQLEELSKFAVASKLRERDPDTFEQFVAQATADGPVQDVFIDANTLMQSGVADQVAILSPSVMAQLDAAVVTGGNIRIPVAEYAARIAASDYGAGLLEHLKTDPQGMSRAEAQEYHQSEIQELEQQVEQAIAGQQNVDEFKAGQQRVKEAILGELNQLGRFTSQKNEVDATIAAARMAVRAAQLGKTPEQFFQDEALRFTVDKVVDNSQQFDQAEQSRNYSEFDQQVQSDMFSGEFADETTTLKREVVVSSNGTTAIVEMPNVDSTGRRITGTTQGLENFWNFYGNGPVDDQGRPVLLYHSTNNDITRFETGRETTNNYGILGDVKTSRSGVFATPSSEFSQEYLREGSGQNVMPIYMGLQNPLDLRQGVTEEIESALEAAGISARYVHNIQNQWELFDNDDNGRNEFVEKLQAAGYDGAIIVEDSPTGESQGGDTYVAFDPTAIKSATGNRGTYDRNDPNILRQGGTLQTDTPKFREWFGDSKVVDESGKPLVVYHGTNQDIEQFNTDGGKGKTFGTGAFFSSNAATANTYTGGINGGNVVPVYLNLKNPAVFDANGANWSQLGKDVKVSLPAVEVSDQADEDLLAELMDTQPKKGVTKKLKARNTTLGKLFPDDFLHEDHFSTDDLARWAKKKGYDGVIIKNVVDHGPTGAMSTPEARDPSNIYVAFNKTAIKSAIGNNGDFNPNDPNILNQPARSSFPIERTVSFNEFQTGVPVTFDFIHNTESATKIFGKPKRNSPHNRYIEPSGRYVSQGTLPEGGQKNLTGGTLTFNNPLVLNVETWKQDLFDHYKKRGKALSQALIADGYDGVVTVSLDERPGRSHTSEILDLTTFDESKAYYQNGPNPQAATNLPKPPTEVQVLEDLPDEVAEDVVTLFKDLGSDDDAFRLPRGASDDLVETIMSALPKDTYAETDFAALEAFQDEAAKRGDPDVLDVKRFDMKVRIKGKPGVMQEKSGFVFTNAAGEVWVDLSDMKEAPGLGANFYTRVRDWADRVGATFVGDPEGLSDDALLKRTEHMASAIARSKSTRSVKAHVRQMDPYNDPIYKTSPLNEHILPLPWLADAKLNERNLIKASWRNIATVMPELKHATIDLRNGQILLENAPITSSFDGFVSGLREGNVTLRGGPDGDTTGGSVQQDPALRKARELYGSASIKRFLLANTAAQYQGESERGLVLARLGELYPVLESLDNQKVFYQTNGKKAQDGESDLIVTHNLTADNLLHAKKMGGIPVPSLAVTKKDTPLDGFGEITLIAPKDMADPQGYAGAKVFGADIYSPRYPSVEYIIPDKTIVKVSREMTTAENATGERLDFDEIRREGVRAFERSAPMMWKFLTDRGFAPEIVRNGVAELSAPLLPFANDTRHTHELREDPAFIEAAWQARREILVRLYDGDESAAEEEIAADRAKDNAYRIVQLYARDIERYQRELREAGKPDSYKTKRAMEQQIEQLGLEEDFKASNREFLESMKPEEKIFQGFTYSGNRKYTAHTLDNVVKILKKELRGGENFNYGVGSLRAKFTPQFKSLAQIRKEKGRLMDKATFEKVKDEIDTEFFRVSNLIERDIRPDTAISIMEDAAKVGIKRAAKTYGFDISDDAAVEIAEFLTQLRNLPTEYFEVKILREVDLAEFAGAVVPEGVDPKVIEALHARGVKDIRTYRKGDEADRAARIGEFEHLFFQRKNGPRGGYNPALNTIALFKGADLSTFLHELGHYFLESDIKIVSDLVNKPELTAGEQQIVKDVTTLFNWFGITGPVEEQLVVWYSLDFEEKRAYHEKAAESFERYLFEGKAPSIELQSYFQTVRAWMTDVYQSIKNFLARNPDAGALTDEVRGVFDRMLATDEQIKLAEHGRSMMPLFSSPDQAGMTPDEFAAYQSLGAEATGEAVQDVQARALRDMQWLHSARGREIRKLKKLSKVRRAEVRLEVSGEVMSQPVYRAWAFLTRKMTAEDKPVIEKPPKSGPGPLDPTVDSLFVAIAKNGGLQKDEVISTWDIDPADKPQSGIFGKPVWRREGGLTIDGMAEALQQDNYLPLDQAGKWDVTDLEELFKSELRGNPQYSTDYAYWGYQEPRPGEGVTEDNVGAGRLDLAELKSLDIPEDAVNRVIGLRMTAKDGIHPDIVAEMFGFTSGDELVRALAYAMPPKQEIEGLTDARLLQNYGELATPEAIERAADKAIHNDARARFVATEVNALAKATGQRKILASAAREFASTMIARIKVRDVRPGQYASAEVRAAKAAVKAMQEGNLVQAAAEKRNQLINNYATRAAYDAQDDVEKGVRYLKKFENESTRKNLDADYTDQIDALLERFDLRKQSLKAIDKRKRLADWITSQREQGLEPEIPEQLENEAFRKSYKEMAVEEFRGLVDTVKQIEHLGRLKNKLLTAADNRVFDEVKTRIAESIEEHSKGRTADTRTPTTNLGRAAQGLRRFWAAHIKAATWARVMDGGNDGGPMWEYFIRSANERGDRETTMRAEATIELSRIMAPVFKLGRMGGKGQFFPSIGRSLNREARIAIALNTGNQGNLQRLLGGEGWNLPQIMPVLQSLSAQEWEAVQAVWDHFESYRPQIAAKERRVYGREPDWIEAKPFTITTSDGQEVSLRGGYYPIKYDPAASQRAEEHADAEGAKRQLQGAYTSATTRRSFTKTRVEEVQGRPLLYTLAGLYSGVNDVIHDLNWHEWLIDTNRLLRSKTIDNAIRSHYGPEAKAQLKTWAADIAEGDKMADNAGEVALGRLRQGISAAGLGFNAMSAALQVLGFTQSIVRVGPTWVGRGIQQYLANPRAASRRVSEMSDFMANRSRTRFRELNELRNKVQDETEVGAAIKGGTFFLMMRAQQIVDVPTWLGAYEKAISEGNDDERAIGLADQAVIDAQGGGQTKDLSAIERGGPALKLFTVFYSFMNTAFNLGAGQTMTAKSKAKLAADYALLYVVPPVLGAMLKASLTPGGDDGDDEDMEALARKLAAEQLSYLMGMMVIVREFSGAAKLITGAEGVRGYEGPAGLRFIPDMTRFVVQTGQGEFDDAFRKSAINVIGDFTGLPSAQVNRTITGAKALNEGETDNPAALIFGFQK